MTSISNKQKNILDKYFKHYSDVTSDIMEILSQGTIGFFDTENSPIFPKEIVEKYNLCEIEYDTLEDFQVPIKSKEDELQGVSDEEIEKRVQNCLFNKLARNKQITTEIYCWQLGFENSDYVIYGNTIQEFLDFVHSINIYKVEKNLPINDFKFYVHNLAYDIEFFKYYFQEHKYKQIIATEDYKEKKLRKQQEYSFDITETDGIVYGAVIQLFKTEIVKTTITQKTKKEKKKTIEFLTRIEFNDSAKITPTSLKDISNELIENLDEEFKKDGSEYKYNIVRPLKDNEGNFIGYKPTPYESWYIYCDIYILQRWWNDFITKYFLSIGITPHTASQISFETILQDTYEGTDYFDRYTYELDKKVTPRMIYERHFELAKVEKWTKVKDMIRDSYKGGHTTASSKYKELSEQNKTIKGISIDITSSYPGQMINKPLPYGMPIYGEGRKPKETPIDAKGNKYDMCLYTIAFDGFESKNPQNQFGLNVKLRQLTKEQQKGLNLPTNESATTNILDGEFVGKNQIRVEDESRKKLVDKYKSHKFIITVWEYELNSWLKDYNFYYVKNGKDVKGVQFVDYALFKTETGHFKKGIMKWYNLKDSADSEGNKALKSIAKLIINSFYGKHCSRRDREQKLYDLSKDIITFETVTDENMNRWEDKNLYAVAFGSAVTMYGRVQLRDTVRALDQTKFIYADTDSIKTEITKEELIQKCKENNVYLTGLNGVQKKLGTFDWEYEVNDLKIIGQKKYMVLEDDNKDFTVKCCGLPKEIRKQIKQKEQFAIGQTFIKKQKKKVPGGYLLVKIPYSLNDLIRG